MDVKETLGEATKAMHRGALAEAERQCRTILRTFSGHYPALILLGQILSRAGQETESLAAFEMAAAASPGAALPFTYLAAKRFRAAFGPPIRPRLPTSIPTRRIQIRSLGRNGRFGNQLLQYAFIRLYAQQHRLVAECPDWIGRDIFDCDDPFPSSRLATINESDADFFGSLHRRTGQVLAGSDIRGFFCGNTSAWGNLRTQFCELFIPARKIQGLLEQAVGELRSRGKTIVAIHLRHGDFGYGRFWVAPSRWYIAWLRSIWSKLDQPVLFVASDTDGDHSEFSEFAPCSARQLGVDIPGADFIVDHYILRQAGHLAISNSTFSFTAAMLNQRALSFVRPHPDLRALVPFKPWSSEILIDPTVALQDVPEAERLFVQNHLRTIEIAVYWGSFCSAWTNFARSNYPKLMILEADDQSSLSDVLCKRAIQRVPLLVLENAAILDQFLRSCDEIFQQAHVDMVLLRSPGEQHVRAASPKFASMGYNLIRVSEITPMPMPSRQSEEQESYLAVRQGSSLL